ncbi:hypothetical protein MO973_46495 [Paenibacillus sp. TRM 82003]|nr:hypothetical protein [Paenibacillus sp. TRM 82003]
MLFFGAYGGLAGLFSNDWLDEAGAFQAIMMDILILTFMSSSGFIFTKGYINNPYWKNDSFTTKLAMLRTLPISLESLALSRLLQVICVTPIMTIFFFTPFYIASEWARQISIPAYIGFMLLWMAFGSVTSAALVRVEWGNHGKKYFLYSVYAAIGMSTAVVVYYFATKKHVAFTLGAVIESPLGWIWPILGLLIAAPMHVYLHRRLCRTIARRDFT